VTIRTHSFTFQSTVVGRPNSAATKLAPWLPIISISYREVVFYN